MYLTLCTYDAICLNVTLCVLLFVRMFWRVEGWFLVDGRTDVRMIMMMVYVCIMMSMVHDDLR